MHEDDPRVGIGREDRIEAEDVIRALEHPTPTGAALRLQVLQGNPAMRLYRRMGFVETGADQMYAQMEWNPPQPPERS